MKTWTIYKTKNNKGKAQLFLTDQPISTLASFLGDSSVEIVYSSTRKSYVLKTYQRELKEAAITNDTLREKYRERIKIRKENGRKVGAFSRDSGHIRRLRETKVICPNGHRSNLQYYKFYCRNRGLDPSKATILPYEG